MAFYWDATPSFFSTRDAMMMTMMGSRERGEGTLSSSFQNVDELSGVHSNRCLLYREIFFLIIGQVFAVIYVFKKLAWKISEVIMHLEAPRYLV